MSITRSRWTSRLAIGLCGMAAATQVGVAQADDPGTRPPGCSSHFKTENIRARTINKNTNMHEMSNPPTCSPHGAYLGMLPTGSEFLVYYADPVESNWCYGW